MLYWSLKIPVVRKIRETTGAWRKKRQIVGTTLYGVRFYQELTISRLSACPPIVTLIFGHDKTKVTCHKALLGHYSEYFDAMFYGSFVEAGKDEFDMTQENAEHMAAFTTRIYTGTIMNEDVLALWVLGDKLRSPAFTNEVMHLVFSKYEYDSLYASDTEYVYRNCPKEAKLRKFVKELILCKGPLSSPCYLEEWLALLAQGGDLVTDIIGEGGSFRDEIDDPDGKIIPYKPYKQPEFLEPITTRPVEDFIHGKMRSGTR